MTLKYVQLNYCLYYPIYVYFPQKLDIILVSI